jgi:hypothetical protein
MKNINFIELAEKGKTVYKVNGKAVAKIYDRAIFYELNKIPAKFSARFPYSLEIKNVGARECASLTEVIEFINKYTK